jgi:hypothetical protein
VWNLMLERRRLRQRRIALFCVLAYAYILHLLRNPTIRKPVHTSAFCGHTGYNEAFRMDAITCEYVMYLHQILVVYYDLLGSGLVHLLRRTGLLPPTRYMDASEQVAIFLYIVAGNASNRAAQERFNNQEKPIAVVFVGFYEQCRFLNLVSSQCLKLQVQYRSLS